ncbi:DNA replication and repair protein RecR [Dietzia kunjamensis subsp. schimae]|uniref:Recombination protein RecR n=1 Tax=Dietzia kunjamensis subsp. schimae TaxID=498198 RepID=A0ABY1MZ20_9ACTN|nr:DNA replication and repair protein RecR [Dietzia kunjamensis subsp. schimae]
MYEGPVQNLIDEFGKLPGIGPKSAQRLAFHLLQAEPDSVERLRSALQAVVEGVTYCEVCGTVAAAERCRICSDPRRDPTLICVVEEPKDIEAIERTREFRGLYHVLGGALDPINGIGPNELRIAGLMRRVGGEAEGEEIAEIIIATDPNTTGEATSTYLARLLRPFPDLVVSRLASGLPMGADLEFADELTLGSALSGRRILSGGPAQAPRSGGVLRPEQIDPAQPAVPAQNAAPAHPAVAAPNSAPAQDTPPAPDAWAPAPAPADPAPSPEIGYPGAESEPEQPRGVSVPHRP